MVKYVIVLIMLFLSIYTNAQDSTPILTKKAISIGETVEIKSEILNELRTLNIYLPLGYDAGKPDQYPVIYLLDGGLDEDFIHIVGLVQFGSFSWINMLPTSIVVGIKNVDRKRDFTFPTTVTNAAKDFSTTGHSEHFINFIEKEVQPFIKKNYKTSDQRTIIGQSFGGLLATEILFKKPDLFNRYVIVSPSLWWDDQSLLKTELKSQANKSIFIAVGKEGEIMENDAKALYDKLKPYYENTGFKFLENQDHGDVLHLAVYSAFEYFKKK